MISGEKRSCNICRKRLDVCRCNKDSPPPSKKIHNSMPAKLNTAKTQNNRKINQKQTKVRLFTFNCLTSAFLDEYQGYPEEIHDIERRHEQILNIIEEKMIQQYIIALQEVENSLKPGLVKLAVRKNYILRDVHNGLKRDNYMGIAIIWPSNYILEDYSQVRVGDTISNKFYAEYNERKEKKNRKYCTTKLFNWIRGKKEIIDPFIQAIKKWNWILLVRLIHPETNAIFTIATYHMPCIFWVPYAMEMHASSALELVNNFSKEKTPTFFMGDFEFTPSSKLYDQYSKYYKSALCTELGIEPEWTCLAKLKNVEFRGTSDYIWMDKDHEYTVDSSKPKVQGILPTKEYPSDHIWIAAVIEWN